jgi:hypothetical protein
MKKTKEINEEAQGDLEDHPYAPSLRGSTALQMGQVAGDVDPSDVILPRLSIAYGVGELSATFNPGDLVLNKEYYLAAKNERLRVVVLAATKYYKEERPPGSFDKNAPPPKIVATKAEILEEGKTTEWRDGPGGERIRPDYREAATFVLLLEKPKDLICPLFAAEFNGNAYTPAIFFVDKNGWKRSAQKVFSAAQLELKDKGVTSAIWELWTGTEELRGNNTTLPYMQLKEAVSDEFKEWIGVKFLGQ